MRLDDAAWARIAGAPAVCVRAPAPAALVATGADRLALLHRLLTADLQGLQPGQGRAALLLTVKGQVVTDLAVLAAQDHVVLLAPAARAGALAEALGRYAVMDDFAVQVAPDGVLGVFGPGAHDVVRAAGLAVPGGLLSAPLAHAMVGGAAGAPLHAVSVDELATRGLWLRGPSEVLAALADDLAGHGAPELPREDAEALRILARRAAAGRDYGGTIAGERFPMEVGLGALIDHGKGCYLGQEPIVRVRDRGHVNWGLRAVRFASAADLRPGDPVEAEGRPEAGRLTSVARLPGRAGPEPRGVALALVHEKVAPGAPLLARGTAGPVPLHPDAPARAPADPA